MPQIIKIHPGCSYHPCHILAPEAHDFIAAPKDTNFVEIGLSELLRHKDQEIYPGKHLSLHLARSPICEDEISQNRFIQHLSSSIANNRNKIISIGLHLTGTRTEGIGKLGFSSHYAFSQEKEQQSVNFIKKIQSDLGLPVWIENANFYSSSPQEVVENWASINRILTESEAKIIFDITHCFIECKNLDLHPDFVFSLVPWDKVVELHISGYVVGSDGALHDGHSEPVKEEVWNLLQTIVNKFIKNTEIIVNIEHSDLSWKNKKDQYLQDFLNLKLLDFKKSTDSRFHEKQLDYAVSNIYRIMLLRRPDIFDLLKNFGHDPKTVLKEWINEFMNSNQRLVFSKQEVPAEENESTLEVIEGFLEYIRKSLT